MEEKGNRISFKKRPLFDEESYRLEFYDTVLASQNLFKEFSGFLEESSSEPTRERLIRELKTIIDERAKDLQAESPFISNYHQKPPFNPSLLDKIQKTLEIVASSGGEYIERVFGMDEEAFKSEILELLQRIYLALQLAKNQEDLRTYYSIDYRQCLNYLFSKQSLLNAVYFDERNYESGREAFTRSVFRKQPKMKKLITTKNVQDFLKVCQEEFTSEAFSELLENEHQCKKSLYANDPGVLAGNIYDDLSGDFNTVLSEENKAVDQTEQPKWKNLLEPFQADKKMTQIQIFSSDQKKDYMSVESISDYENFMDSYINTAAHILQGIKDVSPTLATIRTVATKTDQLAVSGRFKSLVEMFSEEFLLSRMNQLSQAKISIFDYETLQNAPIKRINDGNSKEKGEIPKKDEEKKDQENPATDEVNPQTTNEMPLEKESDEHKENPDNKPKDPVSLEQVVESKNHEIKLLQEQIQTLKQQNRENEDRYQIEMDESRNQLLNYRTEFVKVIRQSNLPSEIAETAEASPSEALKRILEIHKLTVREKESLTEMVEQAQTDITRLTEQQKNYDQSVQDSTQQLKYSEAKINELEGTLMNTLSLMEKEKEEWNRKELEIEGAKAVVEDLCKTLTKENQYLKTELASEEIRKLKEENEILTQQIQDYQNEIVQKDQIIRHHEAEINEIVTKNEVSKRGYSTNEPPLKRLANLVETLNLELNTQKTDLNKEIENAHEQNTALQNSISQLEGTSQQQAQELENSERKIKELQQENASLMEQNTSLIEQNRDLTQRASDLRKEYELLLSKRDNPSMEVQNENEILQKKLKSVEEINNQNMISLEKMTNEKEAFRRVLAEYQEKLNMPERVRNPIEPLDALQKMLNKVMSDIENLRGHERLNKQNYEAKLAESEEDTRKLKTENDLLKQENDGYEQTKQELINSEKRYIELKNKSDRLEEEIKVLKGEAQHHAEANKSLEEEYNRLIAEVNNLKILGNQKINSKTEGVKEKDPEIDARVKALPDLYNEPETQNRKLNPEKHENAEEIKTLKDQIESLAKLKDQKTDYYESNITELVEEIMNTMNKEIPRKEILINPVSVLKKSVTTLINELKIQKIKCEQLTRDYEELKKAKSDAAPHQSLALKYDYEFTLKQDTVTRSIENKQVLSLDSVQRVSKKFNDLGGMMQSFGSPHKEYQSSSKETGQGRSHNYNRYRYLEDEKKFRSELDFHQKKFESKEKEKRSAQLLLSPGYFGHESDKEKDKAIGSRDYKMKRNRLDTLLQTSSDYNKSSSWLINPKDNYFPISKTNKIGERGTGVGRTTFLRVSPISEGRSRVDEFKFTQFSGLTTMQRNRNSPSWDSPNDPLFRETKKNTNWDLFLLKLEFWKLELAKIREQNDNRKAFYQNPQPRSSLNYNKTNHRYY